MLHKIKLFLIHPLVLLTVIAYLECIPYESDLGKKVYHEMPKIGDNFQISGDLAVYYYNGKGKYSYGTADCYFSFGNPSWGATYEAGGIKTIDAQTANNIPLLGNMCGANSHIVFKKRIPNQEGYFATNILLDNFSDISHVLCYLILTLSLLHFFRLHPKKYWFAFLLSFSAGVVLEFVQMFFIVGRSASLNDQLRNTIGAIIALVLYGIIITIIPHKKAKH